MTRDHDAFMGALLEAGRTDEPSPDALARELGRFALAGGLVTTAGAVAMGSAGTASGVSAGTSGVIGMAGSSGASTGAAGAAGGASAGTGASGIAASGGAVTAKSAVAAAAAKVGAAWTMKLAVGSILVAGAAGAAFVENRTITTTTADATVLARSDARASSDAPARALSDAPPASAPASASPPSTETPSANAAEPERVVANVERRTEDVGPMRAPTVPTPPPTVPRTERPSPANVAEGSRPSDGDDGAVDAVPSPVVVKVSSKADEVLLLDSARADATRRPASALAALDEHAARFPHSELRDQAAVVRVEALLARDERASAEMVAAPYLARTGSPIARRMRVLLDAHGAHEDRER